MPYFKNQHVSHLLLQHRQRFRKIGRNLLVLEYDPKESSINSPPAQAWAKKVIESLTLTDEARAEVLRKLDAQAKKSEYRKASPAEARIYAKAEEKLQAYLAKEEAKRERRKLDQRMTSLHFAVQIIEKERVEGITLDMFPPEYHQWLAEKKAKTAARAATV